MSESSTLDDAPLVYLIAGEPSGDALGGRLMAALRELTGGAVRFAGVGGERMAEQGLESLVPQVELALFGILELLPRLPNLLRRIDQTVEDVLARRPAVLVTIDSPGFTKRVAKRVRAQAPGIGLVHYVAPTVWVWKPKRAAQYAALYDHLMTLLPFEPPYFEREGLATSFVGHPVVEGGAGKGDGARFRALHAIPAKAPVLAVLPGSRPGEVKRLLPMFRETVGRLAPGHPGLVVAIPTVATVRATVARDLADWPVPALLVEGESSKYDAFAAATAALAASGTVALELALARLPAVVAYKMNPLTVALYRRFIKVRFANLVNLMLDRMLVPELLNENCRVDRLTEEVGRLLDDEAARRRQIEGVGEVAGWLGEGADRPSLRAARVIQAMIGRGEGK